MPPTDVHPPIRTALARDFYLAYLNTPEWRAKRTRKLHQSGWRCSACGGKRDLQVHHVTYERLGCELDEDLRVLCADCHEREHIQNPQTSHERLYLKIASEVLRASPFSEISDLLEDVKRLCAQRKIRYDGQGFERAMQLIIGTRIKRQPNKMHLAMRQQPPDPRAIDASEAHEIFARLGLGSMIKTMPDVEPTPDEQAAHESKIREQVQQFKRQDRAQELRRRVPLRQRLEAIFAGEFP